MHIWSTPLAFPRAFAHPTSSTNVHSPGVGETDVISLFYRRGNQGTESLCDLTRVTRRVCKWTLKRTQVSWLPIHHLLCHTLQIVSLRRRAHTAPLTLMCVRSYKPSHWALRVQALRFFAGAQESNGNDDDNNNQAKSSAGICGQTQVCCLFSCESDHLFLSSLFLCFLLPFTQVPKILLLKEQARWAASLSPRSLFEMQTLRFQHRDSKSESVFEHDSQVVHMHIKMWISTALKNSICVQ